MSITAETIRRAHLGPELIPDSIRLPAIPQSQEAATPFLDLRRFTPKWLELTNPWIPSPDAATSNAVALRDLQLRVRADDFLYQSRNGAFAWAGGSWTGYDQKFTVHAHNYLHATFYNNGTANITDMNLPMTYGLWVYEPTVAHKLKFGVPLTEEERRIATDLGLYDTVEKGLLPLPVGYQMERQVQVVNEVSYATGNLDFSNPGANYTILELTPPPGQFMIVTGIQFYGARTSAVGAPLDFVVNLSRDNDPDYLQFRAPDKKVQTAPQKCFIPALRELRVTATNLTGVEAATETNVVVLQVQYARMTNIFRARWNLAGADELPAELWLKVRGGVL